MASEHIKNQYALGCGDLLHGETSEVSKLFRDPAIVHQKLLSYEQASGEVVESLVLPERGQDSREHNSGE